MINAFDLEKFLAILGNVNSTEGSLNELVWNIDRVKNVKNDKSFVSIVHPVRYLDPRGHPARLSRARKRVGRGGRRSWFRLYPFLSSHARARRAVQPVPCHTEILFLEIWFIVIRSRWTTQCIMLWNARRRISDRYNGLRPRSFAFALMHCQGRRLTHCNRQLIFFHVDPIDRLVCILFLEGYIEILCTRDYSSYWKSANRGKQLMSFLERRIEIFREVDY